MTRIAGFCFALLAGCAPVSDPSDRGPIAEIAGRTPGPPQRCVPISPTASLRIVDDGRLIYAEDSTVWLNAADCRGAHRDDVPVLHPTGSQHCQGDIVETLNPSSHLRGASCVLGDFIPYRFVPR